MVKESNLKYILKYAIPTSIFLGIIHYNYDPEYEKPRIEYTFKMNGEEAKIIKKPIKWGDDFYHIETSNNIIYNGSIKTDSGEKIFINRRGYQIK